MRSKKDASQIARAAIELHTKGVSAPTAEELAERAYGLESDGLVSLVRDNLSGAMRVINTDFQERVHPVSQAYYSSQFHKPKLSARYHVDPTNYRSCLPLGHGVRPYGVRFVSDGDDVLYLAYHELLRLSEAGVRRKNNDYLAQDMGMGLISDNTASEIVTHTRQDALPTNSERRQRIEQLQP